MNHKSSEHIQNVQSYFDDHAQDWQDIYAKPDQLNDVVLNNRKQYALGFLNEYLPAESNILDAGCGAGGLSSLAVQFGADVCGLDAAESLIAIARQEAPRGDFRIGDLEALPYADHTFDVVLAANSVQYADDPVAALSELKRVTRLGGRIAIGVWGQAENCEFRHIMKAVADAMPESPFPI